MDGVSTFSDETVEKRTYRDELERARLQSAANDQYSWYARIYQDVEGHCRFRFQRSSEAIYAFIAVVSRVGYKTS